MMWPRNDPLPSEVSTQAELAIAATLRGGESMPAWNAVWDLVQSTDAQAKQDVLAALRGYVDTAIAGEPIDQAHEFEAALEESLKPKRRSRRILPSKEVRLQHRQEQIDAHRREMRKMGVRPGDGIPMWMMYMTRRSKRSWR